MNKIKTEEDILEIIQEDEWMMKILHTVASLNLPDWWIGAGFVRSKVWDYLHEYTNRTPIPDVDVIYFDTSDVSENTEETIKQQLLDKMPEIHWQVKNQARMNTFHNDPPYKNATEGLSRWVETPTCVGVSLKPNGKLILTAPLGTADLIHLIVKPNQTVDQTPEFLEKFRQRINTKHWKTLWPKLIVIDHV